MPSQNVEFDAIADTGGKFARLAKLLGLADADHALGRMTHLWMACTTRGETDLPQWLVEQVLGERGPDALVEVDLARWSRGRGDSKMRRMYICGAKKHCLWLRRNQEQSPKGGETRARNASRVAGRFVADRAGPAGEHAADNAVDDPLASGDLSTDQSSKSSKNQVKNTSPLPSPCPSLPSPDPEEPEARSPAAPRAVGQATLDIPIEATAPPKPKPRRDPTSDHQRVIAAFHARYSDRFGHPPTWAGKQTGLVRQLVAKHPADEIIRRIEILFDSPPGFLATSAPDVGTLVQHFDKLVAPQRAGPYARDPDPPRKIPTLA